MATSRLEKTSLIHYRFQRNLVLSLVFFGFFLTSSLIVLATFIFPNSNGLQTISYFVLLLYGIGVLFARQLLVSINTYYHYFRMIDENQPMFRAQRLPLSDQFQRFLLQETYTLGVKNKQYSIYFKLYSNLPFVKRTAQTILWVIELYDDHLGFHEPRLEQETIRIKTNQLVKRTYLNELTLIFKQPETMDKKTIETFQEIINFSVSNRAIITLPCAVVTQKQSIYVLRPNKQYPNKFYYALIQILYELTAAKDRHDGRRN
jgi:hypothetical protein